jgi:hypothetical protein
VRRDGGVVEDCSSRREAVRSVRGGAVPRLG